MAAEQKIIEINSAETDRRGFFKQALAVVLGGIAGLVPLAAGLMVLLDPLRRKGAGATAVKVTTLDALPPDGVPRKFPVVSNRADAWNKYLNVPVGAVYLRRVDASNVTALNVVCPHAGCFVDFSAEKGSFHCPCHNSSFRLDGQIDNPASPAPRAMDSLTVEVRDGGEVWVVFQNFKAGQPEKAPLS